MASFPYLPMAAILVSLVSILVIHMSIFAYAGFMVEYLGIVSHKDKAGYYAGCLSSALMAGRLFSSHFWGLVSDRYGCRFVLVVSLISSAVLSLAFGVSTSFAWAVTCRFVLGLLDSVIPASKTLVPIVCGKEHETVGMGVVSMAWSIGAVLGPGVGGMLAEPAKHHPLTFSENGLFGRNPYLLPNVVGGGLALLSLPLVLIFVHKTKPAGNGDPSDKKQPERREKQNIANANPAGVASPTPCVPAQSPDSFININTLAQTETTPMVPKPNGSGTPVESLVHSAADPERKSLLVQPHIRVLLVIDGLFSFAYTGFDEVFALWSLSTVAKGGLDWSSLQIGQAFLAAGILMILFDVLAVPNLTPRMGIAAFQRVGAITQIPAYLMIPMLPTASAAGLPVTILSISLLLTCYVCTNSFYLGIAVAINNATGPERRGELNGLSAAVTSFTRAFAPVSFSVLFALSIDGNHFFPFDYHLVFYVLALMSLATAYMSWNRIQ